VLSLALKVRRAGGDNTCGEGECRQAIEDQLAALDLQGRVIIHDCSKDIHAIIFDGDFLIFASLWEGMPNVLVESAVIGLAVIVSNILANKSVLRGYEKNFSWFNPSSKLSFPSVLQMYIKALKKWLDTSVSKDIADKCSVSNLMKEYSKVIVGLSSTFR